MKFPHYWTLLVLFIPIFACDVDTGLKPLHSGFKGTVHFAEPWPEDTDQVLVAAAKRFPPTTLEDIVLSEPLPLFQDSASYQVFTPLQTFEAVGVVWKQKNEPWDVTNIIGLYFTGANRFQPGSVVIGTRQEMISNIDITADLSKARRTVNSGIAGRIVIEGEWPETVTSVLVVASSKLIPQSLLDIQFGFPITTPFDTTMYRLSLQPGTYPLIGVLALETDQNISLSSLRGIYYETPGDLFPGTITLSDDSTVVEGVDITANLAVPLL
jgi:hypothetical protein